MPQTGDPILRWLDEEGLTYECLEDASVVDISLPDDPERQVRLTRRRGERLMTVAMVARPPIPRDRWPAIHPLIAGANAEIVLGAWVLEPDSSRLLFRLSIPTDGATYEHAVLRGLVGHVASSVATFEAALERSRRSDGDGLDDVLAAWGDEEP
jgi:hypothetical protein